MNFDQAPLLVIWEVTQACDLACVHCRASAQPDRHPNELTTEEGYRLLDQIRTFGDPLMVFTGGDPLKRPDIYSLIRYSAGIGLRTNVTPSATPLLTAEAIERFKENGVNRMAISLDGPDAATHDDFRHSRDLRPRHVRPAARAEDRPGHPVANHRHAPQHGQAAAGRGDRARGWHEDVEPFLPDRHRARRGGRRPPG